MIKRLRQSILLGLGLALSIDAAEPYGFGKVVNLGAHDTLAQHESLRVLTADTVGFVFYQEGRAISGDLDDAARFTILEDGQPMRGHKVLGRFVKLHHMGHVPKPYLPPTMVGTIYIKLPSPMTEGRTYTFQSRGIGIKDTHVRLTWSAKTILSDAIKVNQI
ncbi:MAG: hypothetical protein AAF492_25045, partial [Verrucomicrobiota bacterium]